MLSASNPLKDSKLNIACCGSERSFSFPKDGMCGWASSHALSLFHSLLWSQCVWAWGCFGLRRTTVLILKQWKYDHKIIFRAEWQKVYKWSWKYLTQIPTWLSHTYIQISPKLRVLRFRVRNEGVIPLLPPEQFLECKQSFNELTRILDSGPNSMWSLYRCQEAPQSKCGLSRDDQVQSQKGEHWLPVRMLFWLKATPGF